MTEPKCKFFGKCGGCSTQHLNYEIQLKNKIEVLKKASGFGEIQVFHGEPYAYRTRMDFHFNPRGVGFREKGSWSKIVDVDMCPISNKRLNEILSEVRNFFKDPDAFDPKKQTGTFRYAVIRTPPNDSSVSFVLNQASSRLDEAINLIKDFSRKSTVQNIVVTYMPPKTDNSIGENYFVVKGEDFLKENFLGKNFYYSVQGFFQNNHKMAEAMHLYVHEKLKTYKTHESHLLDLYGGVGTFGIINAELFKAVTTIEGFQGCTDAAIKNIELNGLKNIAAICKDAMQLKNISLPKPLYVITDPPRSGMHEKTIRALNELSPKVMIYISCNVQQLQKDLPKFPAYTIKSVALFDLFPQTNHMESVVELARKT